MTFFEAFADEMSKLGRSYRIDPGLKPSKVEKATRLKGIADWIAKKLSGGRLSDSTMKIPARKKRRETVKVGSAFVHFEKRWPKDQDPDHNDKDARSDEGGSGAPLSWRKRRGKDRTYISKRRRE